MSDLQLPHHHGEGQNTEFLKAQLAKPETFQTVAGTFKLLDDSSRLRIFWLLCHCEESVQHPHETAVRRHERRNGS